MKLQNISKKLLTGVVFTAALVSCSEDKMDEINKDHNHTIPPSSACRGPALAPQPFRFAVSAAGGAHLRAPLFTLGKRLDFSALPANFG